MLRACFTTSHSIYRRLKKDRILMPFIIHILIFLILQSTLQSPVWSKKVAHVTHTKYPPFREPKKDERLHGKRWDFDSELNTVSNQEPHYVITKRAHRLEKGIDSKKCSFPLCLTAPSHTAHTSRCIVHVLRANGTSVKTLFPNFIASGWIGWKLTACRMAEEGQQRLFGLHSQRKTSIPGQNR